MQKIGDSTSTANAEGEYTNGNSAAGVDSTLIRAEWLNTIQRELIAVVLGGGLTLNPGKDDQVITAIRALQKQTTVLVDVGTAGSYKAVNTPALTALPTTGFIQCVNIANANPGASTYAPDGLPAKPVYGLGLQALQGGELAVGPALLMYLVQAGVNGGNGAWIVLRALGAAQQVGPATKSQHAMQLGQAVGRLIGIQVFTASGVYTPTPGTNSIIVKGVGGGGASGVVPATAAGQAVSGGGGTAGAYGEARFTSGFSGVTVTVGAGGIGGAGNGPSGGATSFGSLLVLPGGQGAPQGVVLSSFPSVSGTNSGSSALPTGANIVGSAGQSGGNGVVLTVNVSSSGQGGASPFGAPGWSLPSASPGTPASGFGAGGGGGVNASSSAARLGGSGGPGVLFVEEYA